MDETKDRGYYSNIRGVIIEEVPRGAGRVLDVGCGLGLTGRAVKETKGAAEVVGVECRPDIARGAESNIDRVICSDVESCELDYPDGHFDVIIMGDVIEHLRDPWTSLAKLGRHLKKEGLLILTFPNIGYWRISFDLIFRDLFSYSTWGILDNTHLRFFTGRTMTAMLEGMNYEIVKIYPVEKPGLKARIASALSLNIFRHIFVWQYLVVARKK